MNQKQKDLLCKMLGEKSDALKRDLIERFPEMPCPYSWKKRLSENERNVLSPGLRKKSQLLHNRERKLEIRFYIEGT